MQSNHDNGDNGIGNCSSSIVVAVLLLMIIIFVLLLTSLTNRNTFTYRRNMQVKLE